MSKKIQGLGAKAAPPPPWNLVLCRGGVSTRLDEHGDNIVVPDTWAWRPHGWPPVSLAHARECGQPRIDLAARARRLRRRPVADVSTGGVV